MVSQTQDMWKSGSGGEFLVYVNAVKPLFGGGHVSLMQRFRFVVGARRSHNSKRPTADDNDVAKATTQGLAGEWRAQRSTQCLCFTTSFSQKFPLNAFLVLLFRLFLTFVLI
ncbi:hypothetical protein SLE2022_341700 [Rubroshorea leprosula]